MAGKVPEGESIHSFNAGKTSILLLCHALTHNTCSDSTLCLGCPPPDPFSTPMAEALPLADQPQLLTPTARREDLFGIPRQQVDSGEGSSSSTLNVLPTRLGLSTRAPAEKEKESTGLGGLGTGSAPYQSSATDQGFHSLVAGRGEALSPAAATCGDADSVRSVDTTLASVLSESEARGRAAGEEDEPQDLSIRQEDLLAAGPSQEQTFEEDRGQPTVSSFTSPKKMMLLREAAREREGLELGENRLATLAGVASELVAKASGSSDSAPEILVVPNTSEREVSTVTNVTVETSRPRGTALATTGLGVSVPHDILLGRWRLALDLFGRVFVDDVGLEPGSIISELGGFPVKEAKFRREMEKLRNSRTVDLTLAKLERDRGQLILQAFKEFNSHYQTHSRRISATQPPLVVNRVKVELCLWL